MNDEQKNHLQEKINQLRIEKTRVELRITKYAHRHQEAKENLQTLDKALVGYKELLKQK